MSQRGGRPIDFQAWAQNQIVKRAVAALEARDEAFAERNADTPLPQLARYLSRCAISLGHSPSPITDLVHGVGKKLGRHTSTSCSVR